MTTFIKCPMIMKATECIFDVMKSHKGCLHNPAPPSINNHTNTELSMLIIWKHTPPDVYYWQDHSGVIVVKLFDYCRVYDNVLHVLSIIFLFRKKVTIWRCPITLHQIITLLHQSNGRFKFWTECKTNIKLCRSLKVEK